MNKGKVSNLLMVFFFTMTKLIAQDVTSINALNDEIGDHLDLEAVASIFGDAKNLEDFEERLNDPKTQISNLDLNEDNIVDYLRVVETTETKTHVIAIQAVLREDMFQDVATLEVEKDNEGKTSIQVVGDVYMYGPNYIIEPVYIHRPVLFSLFWKPFYRPYKSIFYWGYYPKHFHFWHPHPIHTYRKNVHVHINVHHSYSHTHIRRSITAVNIHNKTHRNDFVKKHSNKSHIASIASISKTNGTKKIALQVKQSDGDTFRRAGVNKPNGTKKRVVSVSKANGTKKKAFAVKKTNGSKKVVTAKKKSKSKGKNKGKKGVKRTKGRKKKKH